VSAVILESVLTCPSCGHAQQQIMPTVACQYFYAALIVNPVVATDSRGILSLAAALQSLHPEYSETACLTIREYS
jgi:hypothetical protein